MNRHRFLPKARVLFVHVFILLGLVASGCGPAATATEAPAATVAPATGAPATEAPTEAATEAPAATEPAASASILECSEPYPSLDHAKPPLSLSQLPLPEGEQAELLFDPERVIGFNFPDGQPALIASPAQAECLFDEALGGGQALGVVWKFDPPSSESNEPSKPTGYILAVDPANTGTFQGKLVSLDFTEAEDIAIFHSDLTKQTDQDTELIDASIWAGGVCFRVGEDRFCTSGSGASGTDLAVRSFQSDKYQTIIAEVMEAEKLLIEKGIVQPGRDTVLYDQAISEIEDPGRIEACQPGGTEALAGCQADIILAAIAAGTYPASGEPWGVVVVVQELNLPDTDLVIPPGNYAAVVEVGDNGELLSAKLEGITETEEPLSEEVPAVLTPYVDSTGNAGQAGIFTCSLGKICLFWECR